MFFVEYNVLQILFLFKVYLLKLQLFATTIGTIPSVTQIVCLKILAMVITVVTQLRVQKYATEAIVELNVKYPI